MNSAAGSALIAEILSGVLVIVGVVLGAWLQSRSTDREHPHRRGQAVTRARTLGPLAPSARSHPRPARTRWTALTRAWRRWPALKTDQSPR